MRANEFICETTTTLNQLYLHDGLPDSDELFWDYVGTMDLRKSLSIQIMPRHKIQIMLLSQCNVEHLDEITDMLDENQQEVVEQYMNDPQLSNQIIVVCDGRIIDGNHRALAAAMNGTSIKYVDLSDLDEPEDIDETVNDKLFWSGYQKEKPIPGGYILVASAGYVGYGAKPDFKSNQFRIVAKSPKGGEIGWVNFEKQGDHLEALDLSIQPEHRRKGIATEMYRFARSLGNDIQPSKLQTASGKLFWNKDHSKEVAEAELDPSGWGNTPMGTDVDYFGMKVQMRPSMFLKLAAPLTDAGENPEVYKYMEKGGKIAYPFLDIQDPREWENDNFDEDARVKSHEGRNRMKKWIQMHGDNPIQINIFLRGANRRKYITPEIINRLSQGLFSETGNYVTGPIFDPRTAQ